MTLQQLNQLHPAQLRHELSRCCGSSAWVEQMTEAFPALDTESLLKAAERVWFACSEEDWREAFSHHPKIGDTHLLREKFAATGQWAGEEQSSVAQTPDAVLRSLAEGNRRYENKFGYIFIVFATGKTAADMLALLETRLHNTASDEIRIAMEEQNKITQLRLQKLLSA